MARAPRRASGRDVQELIEQARSGSWAPAQVLVGSERFLLDRAVGLLKQLCLDGGVAGFNDDVFHGAASLSGQKVVSAARTLPMMAQARFVLVRGVDQMSSSEQEHLAAYLGSPADSTCMVLTADKLPANTKLGKAAKQAGVLFDAKPLKGVAVRRFVSDEARRRGHALSSRAAEALVEAVGEDLAALDDALERLSLYVGGTEPIEVDAVTACVSRIATDSIWSLVDAVAMRDTKRAMSAVGSLLSDREPPLRILAMVARQLRMVAKMREALASGLRGRDAALEAGAPPFKARELTESARRFTQKSLSGAFAVLADADLALKGSRRPPERVLEEAILQLCSGRIAVRERIPRRVRTYR